MRKILLTAVVLAAGAASAAAQHQDKDKRGLVWDDRPTIVFGEDITVGIRGRLQLDWRQFNPGVDEDTFDFRTARIGLQGDVTRHFSYEIEREVDREAQFGDWKDVYLAWKTYDAFRIKAGRFKMPFGLEQNTGPTETDFAYRSLISTAIAPARDRGAMVYGELGRLGYEVGVFDDDGANAVLEKERFAVEGEDLADVGPSFAGRVTGDLFRLLPVPDKLKSANFGVAYTNASVPEGLNSLKGESVFGSDVFKRVYVKGRRQRIGAQFDWTPGPTGLKAEWMQAREQSAEALVWRWHWRGRTRRALRRARAEQREQGRHRLHQPSSRPPGAELGSHLDIWRQLDAHTLGAGSDQRHSRDA